VCSSDLSVIASRNSASMAAISRWLKLGKRELMRLGTVKSLARRLASASDQARSPSTATMSSPRFSASFSSESSALASCRRPVGFGLRNRALGQFVSRSRVDGVAWFLATQTLRFPASVFSWALIQPQVRLLDVDEPRFAHDRITSLMPRTNSRP
jgi:hypothetical protein